MLVVLIQYWETYICVYAFIQHWIVMNRQPCGLTGGWGGGQSA